MAPVQTASTPTRHAPAQEAMTYEEFLDWCDEDTFAEWVNGKVIIMSPPPTRHQQIADFLVKAMGILAEERNLGHVISAPFQMKMESGREPDVLFVAEGHRDRLTENYLDGPADLAVEVVSPTSGPRDRGEKFYEYEAGGVVEYWLVDPVREEMEVYRLKEGRYRLVRPEDEDRYRSDVVPGFWLKASWLWQDPLPKVLDVLRQWEVV